MALSSSEAGTPPPIYPELFIGLVAAVGTDHDQLSTLLEEGLRSFGYGIHSVRLTKLLRAIPRFKNLKTSPVDEYISSHQKAGDEFRELIGKQECTCGVGNKWNPGLQKRERRQGPNRRSDHLLGESHNTGRSRKGDAMTDPTDRPLKKAPFVTQAPPPFRPLRGSSLPPQPKPTAVLDYLPPNYPASLAPGTLLIVGKAAEKFPFQTQVIELCKYVITKLRPHLRKAILEKIVRQDMALTTMDELLHYPLVRNSDSDSGRYALRSEYMVAPETETPLRAASVRDAISACTARPNSIRWVTWAPLKLFELE